MLLTTEALVAELPKKEDKHSHAPNAIGEDY
jgi:hypothetical protein